jgi:predicted PurR-regulated permease PerM
MAQFSKSSGFRSERYLGMASLSLLIIGAVYVMMPFMTALMWSAILAFSLWPTQRLLTRWFRGRRTLASVVVALTVSLLLVGPFVLLGFGLADDAALLGVTTKKWLESAEEKPPEWTLRVPIIGESVEEYWVAFHQTKQKWLQQINKGMEDVPPKALVLDDDSGRNIPSPQETIVRELNKPEPEVSAIEAEKSDVISESRIFEMVGKILVWAKQWLLDATLGVLKGMFQIVLSVMLTFFILRDGQAIGARIVVGAERIAGVRGQNLIKVAGSTVRGVVYGIIGTAIAQGLLAGLGLGLAGVPAAALLGFLTFFLSAVPFGPPLVWIPATVWLFSTDKPGWAVFMLIWGIFVVSGVDNVIKPYLISHGAKIPFAVVLLGVLGGALAFGLVGVFLGPTLLAVVFRLVEDWSSSKSLLAATADVPIEVPEATETLQNV